ncbi:MAG: OmpA family protein [Chitinophagaceae bacterium]|nr:MAG: OmpA family protein [Chitinophagaceae bacterium]
MPNHKWSSPKIKKNVMKIYSLLTALILSCLLNSADAQGLLKRLGNKAAEMAGDRAVNKTVDAADKKAVIKKKDKGTSKDDAAEAQADEKEASAETKKDKPAEPRQNAKAYSKFDFVPGEKIIFAEDFQQDVVGEFPLKWFTNGSAEVVELEGHEGKWLMPMGGSILTPTMTIPKDFTLEFDIYVNLAMNTSASLPGWKFELYANGEKTKRLSGSEPFNMTNRITIDNDYYDRQLTVDLESLENKKQKARGKETMAGWNPTNFGTVVHVAMWVQDERVRVWYNQNKIYDNPTGSPANANFNQLLLSAGKKKDGEAGFYLSNFKLAVGAPDTRNKLMVEGKFSTTGILFDSGSDKIKPTSAGTLKEIAGMLKSDASVHFKIIGHTDGDGNAAANLTLSKKRAEAVKKALVADYGIIESSLETDGMGDMKPVADNKTSLGKAQNRRVEFIKKQD